MSSNSRSTTTEQQTYVTPDEMQTAIDSAVDTLASRFDQKIDDIKTVIDSRREAHEADIKKLRRDGLEEASKLVEDKIKFERDQRQKEISEVRDEMRQISERTEQQYTQLNGKIDQLAAGLGGKIDGMKGTLENWRDAMSTVHRDYDQVNERVDDTRDEVRGNRAAIKDLDETIEVTNQEVASLRQSIHGDGEGGRPSLYSLITTFREDTKARFDAQDQARDSIVSQVASLAANLKTVRERVTTLEERQTRLQRWSKQGASYVRDHPKVVAGLVATLLTFVTGIYPGTRELAQHIISELFAGF